MSNLMSPELLFIVWSLSQLWLWIRFLGSDFLSVHVASQSSLDLLCRGDAEYNEGEVSISPQRWQASSPTPTSREPGKGLVEFPRLLRHLSGCIGAPHCSSVQKDSSSSQSLRARLRWSRTADLLVMSPELWCQDTGRGRNSKNTLPFMQNPVDRDASWICSCSAGQENILQKVCHQ